MKSRMKTMHDKITKIKKQKDRLTEKVKLLVEKQSSIELNPSDHQDMIEIIQKEGYTVCHQSNMTKFQQIFWEQQAEAAKKSKSQGMRWHPLMIRWCIYIRHQSQKAYETMRKCGILLPSQRTLCDYSHHIKATPGFTMEVDAQLCQSVKLEEREEWEKHIILLIDEMHIKEGLVFNKHTG